MCSNRTPFKVQVKQILMSFQIQEELRKKAEGIVDEEQSADSNKPARIPTKLPNRYTSVAYNQQY